MSSIFYIFYFFIFFITRNLCVTIGVYKKTIKGATKNPKFEAEYEKLKSDITIKKSLKILMANTNLSKLISEMLQEKKCGKVKVKQLNLLLDLYS